MSVLTGAGRARESGREGSATGARRRVSSHEHTRHAAECDDGRWGGWDGRMGGRMGRSCGLTGRWTSGRASGRTIPTDSGDERGRFGRAANADCILSFELFRGLRFGWADEQVDAWADGQADERTEKLTDESYPDYERGRFEREAHTGSILYFETDEEEKERQKKRGGSAGGSPPG